MSSVDNYTNSLYDAMKMFADYSNSKSKSPLTIECKILEQADAGLGTYIVKYLDNTFIVYADAELTYSIGDTVTVLVPEGDFSKNKFILGSTKFDTSTITPIDENIYYDISDNLITLNIKDSLIQMSSYHAEVSKDYPITNESPNTFGQMIKGYAAEDYIFRLDAKVKTSLPKEQQYSGNYGVSIYIPVANDGYEIYTLDTTTMMGSPYLFTSWSDQSLYFSIPKTYDDTRIPFLRYFCTDDFIQDESKKEEYDIFLQNLALTVVNSVAISGIPGYYLTLKASEGTYYNNNFKQTKVITPTLRINGKVTKVTSYQHYWFVEDTSIKASSSDYLQYGGQGWRVLNKKASDGSYLNETTLTVNKQNVSSATRFKCVILYGNNESKFITVSSIITLKNLESDKILKLDTDTLNHSYTDGDGFVTLYTYAYQKDVTDKEDYKSEFFYTFVRYGANGEVINDVDNFFKVISKNELVLYDINNDGIQEHVYLTKVQFPISVIDDINTVYCSCVRKSDDTIYDIGTDSLAININNRGSFTVSLQNSNILYKYDAQGHSPFSVAFGGPISSKLDGIKPVTFKVYKEDGRELTESEYPFCYYKWIIPKESLIIYDKKAYSNVEEDDDFYYIIGINTSDNSASLAYTISDTYNKVKAANNSVLAITYGNETQYYDLNINFTKNGENGTNGTSYAGILMAGTSSNSCHYYGAKVNAIAQKIKFIYSLNPDETQHWYICDIETGLIEPWTDNCNIKLYPKIYKDAEMLDPSRYSIQYSMFSDKEVENFIYFSVAQTSTKEGVVKPNDRVPAIDSQIFNVVRATVTINETGNEINSKHTLYLDYPIDVMVVECDSPLSDIIYDEEGNYQYRFPTINGGFYNVLYNTDYLNPEYDSTENFYFDEGYDNIDYTISWNIQGNLIQSDVYKDEEKKSIDTTQIKVEPKPKYYDGKTYNCVESIIELNLNDRVATINDEINDLKNKKDEQQLVISDTTDWLNAMHLFETKWNVQNAWVQDFNNINELLALKSDIATKISNILQKIDNIRVNSLILNSDGDTLIQTLEHTVDSIENIESQLYENLADGLITIDPIVVTDILDDINAITKTIENQNIINTDIQYYNDLANSVDICNATIVKYNDLINNNDSLIISYVNLYKDILDAIGTLPTKEANIISRLQQAASFYFTFTSLLEFNNFIYSSYDTCLSYYYDKENNTLILSDYAINNRQQIIAEAGSRIDELDIAISELEVIKKASYFKIKYSRPIILQYNRYGMEMFNAWDGNKIYVDDNKSFLMAPQIGAGVKNNDNSFTGIFMGPKVLSNQGAKHNVGLYAFHKGQQTFKLSADDGSAIFGKSKSNTGQIVIDPTQDDALYIYSTNFFKDTGLDSVTGLPNIAAYNEAKKRISQNALPSKYTTNKGMIIDLSTPGILFGSNSFSVNADGHMHAGGGGDLAGWDIGDTTLTSRSYVPGTSGICLDAGNNAIKFGSNSGEITSGKHTNLNSTEVGFYLSNFGMSIGDKFLVDASGVVHVGAGATKKSTTSPHWIIDGSNDNSYIRYGKKGDKKSVYLGTDSISLGSKFNVTNEGILTAKEGYLGEWRIHDNFIERDNNLGGDGSNIIGTMRLATNCIYGFNKAGLNSSNYQAWQLNANGLAFFSVIYLYRNNAGMPGEIKIAGGSITDGDKIVYKNGKFNILQESTITVKDSNNKLRTITYLHY